VLYLEDNFVEFDQFVSAARRNLDER